MDSGCWYFHFTDEGTEDWPGELRNVTEMGSKSRDLPRWLSDFWVMFSPLQTCLLLPGQLVSGPHLLQRVVVSPPSTTRTPQRNPPPQHPYISILSRSRSEPHPEPEDEVRALPGWCRCSIIHGLL